MGLIKSKNAPASVSAFSMRDIEKQATALLAQARHQAEQFLAAAQSEAEELKKQSRLAGYVQGRQEGQARGHEEGLAAGREQALVERREELKSLICALSGAVDQINTSRLELEASAAKDVLGLAIAIAERVTKKMGVLDPQVAVANVTEAMKLVGHQSDVRITIHPSQKAALDEALPQLKSQWPKLEHVELIEDAELSSGGCRVFTAHGQIDGSLEEQLRRITAELLGCKESA